MRAVIQRVRHATVEVEGEVVGRCGPGLLVLLGVGPADGAGEVAWMARKIAGLRIFADDQGKFDRSLLDVGGEALVVSQFTLFADCRKGRRPNFSGAARPAHAEPIYRALCAALRGEGVRHVGEGVFAANMQVSLVNDGPVTLVMDSP
ncbi:MAG: D-aminoacyl-tRNA deacylase [Myxococcota bacterium]|nr:D-aminoacyl-tRNA deacylase [Myxococcota bacterium]